MAAKLLRLVTFVSTLALVTIVVYVRNQNSLLKRPQHISSTFQRSVSKKAQEQVNAQEQEPMILKDKDGIDVVPGGSHVSINLETGEKRIISSKNRNLTTKTKSKTPIIDSPPPPGAPLSKRAPRKWKIKFSAYKEEIDELLKRITVEHDPKAVEQLEIEASKMEVGAGLLFSDFLGDFLALFEAADPQKRLWVTSILHSALHNNEVALMRADEINLVDYIIFALAHESNVQVQRSCIIVLHSMICHGFSGYPLDSLSKKDKLELLYKNLRDRFLSKNGQEAILQAALNKELIDDLIIMKAVDILLSVGRNNEARKVFNQNKLSAEAINRLCHAHPNNQVIPCSGAINT